LFAADSHPVASDATPDDTLFMPMAADLFPDDVLANPIAIDPATPLEVLLVPTHIAVEPLAVFCMPIARASLPLTTCVAAVLLV
jgi:hypothetical protein